MTPNFIGPTLFLDVYSVLTYGGGVFQTATTLMGFNTWDWFLPWLKSPSIKALSDTFRLIATQAVVYTIWHERNA